MKGVKKICVWCGPSRPCQNTKGDPERCDLCHEDNRHICFHAKSRQGQKGKGEKSRYTHKPHDKWRRQRTPTKSNPKSNPKPNPKPNTKSNKRKQQGSESIESVDDLETSVATDGSRRDNTNRRVKPRRGANKQKQTRRQLADSVLNESVDDFETSVATVGARRDTTGQRVVGGRAATKRKYVEYSSSEDSSDDNVAIMQSYRVTKAKRNKRERQKKKNDATDRTNGK